MTNNNWSYEELGFKSESEMKDSIKRAEHKLSLTRDELIREEHKERFRRADTPFNFNAAEEGARLEALDDKVFHRIKHEREQQRVLKEQQERQDMLNSIGELMQKENEKEAQKEYEKQKEEAEAKLRKELNAKHNVSIQTEEEKEREKGLSDMITNLLK